MATKRQSFSQRRNIPVALTIAGSDSSAGAGAQADLKTFTARKVYGVTALTCIVAETPGRVSRIQAAEPDIVREQIELLLRNFPVAALKTGLLCTAAIAATVARTLRDWRSRSRWRGVVVDPVIIATSGDRLLDPEAIEIYKRDIFPSATLLTPNIDEAMCLLGYPIHTVAEMHRAAEALAKQHGVAVLLKGGHLGGGRAVDVLHDRIKASELWARRVRGVRTHGTGCTYSAAIVAELAKGRTLIEAVRIAKRFVSKAIQRHLAWQNPGGRIHALKQG